jgi:hypothetical protein
MSTALSQLRRPDPYLAALERLAGRAARGVSGEQLSLPALIRDRHEVSRLLARAVAAGDWRPAPAAVRVARLDKERELFRFGAVDRVVHAAVAQLLVDVMEAQLSPALYSYRRGRSSAQAVRALAAWIRAHRRARPDPRTRGLWVLRADVLAYGDSIPMHARSPLWAELRALFAGGDDAAIWRAVEAVVRPLVAGVDGPCQPIIGVPTGSPVATALANLYLTPLDRELDRDPRAFYARYGDDLVYAHPDLDAVRDALARAERLLAGRNLQLHPGKLRLCWFNGAGRRDGRAPELPGAARIAYLGCRIDFDATIGLTRGKAAALLHELRARIWRTAALVEGAADEQRVAAVCGAVATALDPRVRVAAPHADLLAAVVDDRRQLGELDYWIARAAAGALAGRDHVRAFRTYPWRRLRAAGLPSLVARRNRGTP